MHSVKLIKELEDIVSDIIVSVSFLSLDVYDICKRVFVNRKLIDYSSFTHITGGDFPSCWSKACDASLGLVNEEDKSIFCEIGSILGSCDSESQIKKLSHIENMLERSYLQKSDKLEATKRLYYIISICIGLVICLLIA